jgi:hypothetical protein
MIFAGSRRFAEEWAYRFLGVIGVDFVLQSLLVCGAKES